MAQQAEHVLGKDEVTGSNPVSSSRFAPPALLRAGGIFVFVAFFSEIFAQFHPITLKKRDYEYSNDMFRRIFHGVWLC